MDNKEFFDKLTGVNPALECLAFLYHRILRDDYRGTHKLQHYKGDLGALNDYESYIIELLKVWRECERVLKPNAKLCINVPLMPMLKKDFNTHYNRHIFDLQNRLIKMFSFVGDLVLDPFAGSGTTLKVAKELKRNFVGYEIYEHYKSVIEEKLHCHKLFA